MTPSPGNPTILLIDDTPSNLSVVVDLFEERGYRVSIAQDGEEGLQRAKLLRPDLIMLDVMMPGVDGFETCRRLKKEPLTCDIPVIFMTALASAEHKVKGFQSGAVDYVTKPLQIDEVIARACTHLKLHAVQRKLAEHNEELERRVAERTAELAVREREFRTLAQNHPDGIIRQDRQGRLLFVNESALHTVGLLEKEVLGKTVCELPVPGNPAVLQPVFDAHQRVLTSGKPDIVEFTWPNGHTSEIRHIPEYDEQGRVVSVLAIARDITERKQAERLLHEREQALRAVVENSPDTIMRYDSQCRRIYLNPAMEEIFGHPREQLLGTSPAESSPLPGQYLATIRKTLETGTEQRMESSFRDAEGRVRWVDLRLAPEFDAEGKVVTVLAIGRDITERKFAEEALVAREREFRTLVENVPDNISRHDLQGRFVYINPQMEKTLQRSAAALYGTTPLDLSPESPDVKRYFDCILLVAQTGVPLEYEATLPDTGEGPRYHSIQLVAERDADGRVTGVLTLGRDVTEHKRAERLLHEQEQAIRAVVENSPDAYARYDRQFRRLYVNPATQGLLGLPLEEIIGKQPQAGTVLPPEFTQLLESVFLSGTEVRTEMPFRWANGERGWGDVRIVPEFGPDGRVATVLSIGRDITERKRVDDLLREERGLFVGGPTVVFKWRAAEGWPVEYVSPNVLEQFGYAPETLTNGDISFSSILHPQDRAWVAKEVSTYTAEGRTTYEQVYRIAHANGGYRWIYDFTVVSRREDGSVDHYHGYVMDITDRKNAENALKESEQRYRMVFENSPISLWEEDFSAVKELFDELRKAGVTDIDAHFDRHPIILGQCADLAKIVDVNQAAVALHEATDKAELFAGLVNTFTAESFDAFRRELVGLWNGQTAMNMDAVVRTLAGERRDVTVHFSVCPGYEDSFSRVLVSLVDITERKRAERELKESRAQLRGLTAQREAAREEERKRIAREVHDELGQILTGLKLNVSVLDHMLSVGQEIRKDRLQETLQLTDNALDVARNVASALRPAALDMGIVSALEWLAGRFSSNTGIHCEVHSEERDIPLGESQAIALFRIVQESLTNVSRHAKADHVDVLLALEGNDYVLKVRDNGAGFDVGNCKTDSFGLVGIRERALMLGGTVEIASRPGKGTEVAISIPVQTVLEET